MDKENKFRFFDGVKMHYPETNYAYQVRWLRTTGWALWWIWDGVEKPIWEEYGVANEYPMMKYLNLKVKDGAELYNGDIVKYPNLIEAARLLRLNRQLSDKEKEACYETGEVVFYDGCTWIRRNGSMFCLAWAMTPKGNPHEPTLSSSSIEKLGNVYENQELLTTTYP